tara:strand:- start:718 stop:1110 length:393 start_codon:yes stop_codon:yes gene_type:complete
MEQPKNMFFSLVDADMSSKKETNVTYDDLLEQVNSKSEILPQDEMDIYSDLYFAEVLDYKDNYTKKQLEFIAGYYDIKTRKKRKEELAEDIVIFEKAEENVDLVQRRKMMWFYIDEISNDSYLSKYLILE